MKIKYSFLTLLFFLSLSLKAQYEALLHKPYADKVLGIHAMYRDLIDINDSTSRAAKANEIINFAKKNKDKNLVLEVEFFQNFWNTFYQNQPKDISLKKLNEQLESVRKDNPDCLRARSLRCLAEFYWKIERNYELSFEQYLLLDKDLASYKPEDYPEMARDLMQIGKAYYFFRDYRLANIYLKKAIAIPENSFNTIVINDARNTLGLSYQYLNELDSADYFFNQILQTKFKESEAWKRIALGNIGTGEYYRQNYGKAIPLLEIDFKAAVSEGDWGSAAGSATVLADIYIIQNKLYLAETYLKTAQQYIRQSGQTDRLRLLYPVMSKWYVSTGNMDKAKQFIDSSTVTLNKFNEKYSALNLLRAQQKVDLEKYRSSLQKIDDEKKNKIIQRNLVIVSLLALLILTLWAFREQRRSVQLKQIALKDAEKQIKGFLTKIMVNNHLIETLESQVEGINIDIIVQLQQSTILNEEEWVVFKSSFEKLHPGFLTRLRNKLPELSPADVRFVVLTKLQFNPKEMAATLGVGAEAIRQYRLRLRKKLDLNTDISIEKIVTEI